MKQIVIEKAARRLRVLENERAVFSCAVALGFSPLLPKMRMGDGRTPEGEYYVCLKRAQGKFGKALGLSYPSLADARGAAGTGLLSPALLPLFERAEQTRTRPPWGTSLGGEIYIHGGGADRDWTAGCIALSDADMRLLFEMIEEGAQVEIRP